MSYLGNKPTNIPINGTDLSDGIIDSAKLAVGAVVLNSTDVVGVLPITLGGTGSTTTNIALNTLLPTQTGNSGKFVTTDGTNASWGIPPAGSIIYLSTVTASAASTVDIETGFSSTYDDYLIVVNDMYSSNAVETIKARLKIGGSYITSGYDGFYLYLYGSTETGGGYSLDTSSWIAVASNGSNDSVGLCINLFGANSSRLKTGTAVGNGMYSPANNYSSLRSGFGCRTAGVMSGIRIFPLSGTISGVFKLYGIAKA